MKFNYALKDGFFKYYNEANGVIFTKKKFINKNKKSARTYLSIILTRCILTISLAILLVIGVRIFQWQKILPFAEMFLWFSLLISLFLIIDLILSYRSTMKNNSLEGTLTISKKGLTDLTADGKKIELGFDCVEVVVITKNTVMFVLNSPYMIYINNNDKKRLLKALNKHSNVLIVDTTEE